MTVTPTSDAQFASAIQPLISQLIAGTITASAFQTAYVTALGAWPGPGLAALAQVQADLVANLGSLQTRQFQAWLNGTATGGPGADGKYPLTINGADALVACPAKMKVIADAVDSLTAASGTAVGAANTATTKAAAASASAAAANTDRLAADADAAATAGDRAAVHADKLASDTNATATAGDRVQTGLDRVQTGLDRTQTGVDRAAADTAATTATSKATDAAASQAATLAYLNALNLQVLPPESGYVFAIIDPLGRSVMRIRTDGTLEVVGISLPAGSVSAAALTADLAGLIPVSLPIETGYVWSLYDPATNISVMRITAGGVLELDMAPTLPAGSITRAAIDPAVTNLLPLSLPIETGYSWALYDPLSGIAPVRVTAAGALELDLPPSLPAGSIGRTALDTELSGLTPKVLNPESGYIWALYDPVSGLSPVRVTTAGTLEAEGLTPGVGSIAAATLALDAQRQALPQNGDVVPVLPDVWRQRNGEVRVETGLAEGTRFVEFPDRPARLLRGLNASGAPIDVRRSAGLKMIGRNYVAAFDPGAWPSIVSIGHTGYSAGAITLSTAGRTAGDYYWCGIAGQTFGGTAINVGDLIVYGSDAAFHIQSCPGSASAGAQAHRSWWNVSAAGTFAGLPLAVGDRILFITASPLGGLPAPMNWYRGNTADLNRNDLWYRGEFTPASGLPASPIHGDVWQASAAGAAGGFTFANGDYAIYENAAWSLMPNDPFVTYASGAGMGLRCGGGMASEWEVRRSDKASGSSRLSVALAAQAQSVPRKTCDRVSFHSDSMGGNGTSFLQTAGLLYPRAYDITVNGGGSSRQVLGNLELAIVNGDLDLAAMIVAWHGQNNQPGSGPADLNMAQIKEVSLRLRDYAGARDRKLLLLSVLGQRNMAWNGTRITATQQENQFNKTGPLWDLRQWYEREFPGQFLHPHAVLLSAATDAPDPTFPSDPTTPGSVLLTEKQVAARYGIVPWSFHGNSGLTLATSALNYRGAWTGATLPTGGSSGYYYLRTDTAGLGCGALLVNEAGTWVERQIDITHLGTPGGAAMASGGAGFLSGGVTIPAAVGIATFIINSKL